MRTQGRVCWARPLLGLTTYLYGGSGYPTLGRSRLRDPNGITLLSFSRLSSSQTLSFSLLFLTELRPPLIHSLLLFIALANGVIIIIFSLSAKKGPISINLSGFLGTSGFGNGSHCSERVRRRGFLSFCRALEWRTARASV